MDRRSLLLALAGGAVATSAFGISAASAAPAALGNDDPGNLAGVRAALDGEPVEMQRRGGRGGGGRGFRGGGGRRGWGGGGGWGRRRGWGGGGWGRRRYWGGGPGWGWRRRRYWGGPGPYWGPRRRCFVNRWGEFVCRRPPPIYW